MSKETPRRDNGVSDGSTAPPDANGILVEEGAAFARLHAAPVRAPQVERFDVVVVGAGQAGLATGYYLARAGVRFVILDAEARVGDSWRKRWDSLRLFTPAALDGLVGMPFPAPRDYFPTKDEMGDYLRAYAARFKLPVRSGVRVERVSRRSTLYRVETSGTVFEAAHVVVATASYQTQHIPEFARALDASIVQLSSSAYKNPAQLKPGAVLLVGAGNSGAELAVELAPRHYVYMAGRDTGRVPFNIRGWLGRNVLCILLLRGVFHRLLTLSTPFGRRARPKLVAHGGPLIRVRSAELDAGGVERTARVASVKEGKPLLEDGRVLDVANVIWTSGFRPNFAFLDLPGALRDRAPAHRRGVVEGEPGLYLVGLHFQYAMSSTMVHGVSRDAGYVVERIVRRMVEAPTTAPALTTGENVASATL